MEFELTVTCDCGTTTTFKLEPLMNKISGRVYEDHSSISNNVGENLLFSAEPTQENEVTFTCKVCNKNHYLMT